MRRKEFRVGETFEIYGKKYKCVDQPPVSCWRCALKAEKYVCAQVECIGINREDKTEVIFILEEKGGEK